MSYILDALRKSEAARRSREAPDLLAQTSAPLSPAPSARDPKYAPRPAWALAMVGLVALVLALWLRSGDERAEPASQAFDAESAESNASLDNAHVDTFDAPPTDVSAMPSSRPNTEGMPSARASAVSAPARTDDSAVDAPAPRPMTPPPSTPTAAVAPPGPPIEPTSRPSPVDSAPPAAATGASPAPNDDRPVALADIAPDLRRQMPALKLSMHLWNPQPERRLLVLDGQRLRQGDVLGEVVVERIERDRVVLSWRGARIALPVE